MEIQALDHVNIQTTEITEMEEWYIDILGLEKGYRPPFQENGSWLYGAGHAMLHLVEAQIAPERSDRPELEHFAMRATGLKSLLDKLAARKIPYYPVRVPDVRILQINFRDPEGNHLHIDFSPEEADALGFN
jgi:catechol 2,3-dioxygenase-like lactoylglutathione lyase family enzyme